MKTQKFKIINILFVVFLLNTNAFSQKFEETKSIHKELIVNELSVLDINNKFGNITINDWDKQDVVVDIKITTKAASQEKAQKMLNLINVEISEVENVNKFVTVIDDKINQNNSIFDSGKQEFQIDYTVNMPRNLKLNIINKFGDVFVKEIHGKSNIEVKYGSFKAEKLLFDDSKPLSKISISYGDCSVEKTSWMTLITSYSKSVITEATAVIVVSKYSDVNIDKANSIVSEARYDNYKLGVINNFNTTAKYTDFKIEQLGRKLNFDLKYGNCKINNVSKGFDSFVINVKYVDVEMTIQESASYQLNAIVEYGDISYPKEANIEKHVSVGDTKINGIIGSDKSAQSKIEINCSYGDIKLQ